MKTNAQLCWSALLFLWCIGCKPTVPPHKPEPQRYPPDLRCASKPCDLKLHLKWQTSLLSLRESSARAVDLNGDGVKDIVVGGGSFGVAGGPDCYLYAVDGRTGKKLWSQQFRGDVYGTPTLVDINRDRVKDILVTGRFNNVYAVDGRTGNMLWDLKTQNSGHTVPEANFNTPVLVKDQDRDGVEDAVVVQGGDLINEGISIGRLYVLSSRTGKIIKWIQTPDKREIFSVPAYHSRTGRIVIGTGGERIPGHIYTLEYPSLKPLWRWATYQKGVIGSPLLFKPKGKSYYDVWGATFDGSIVRLDGKKGTPLWQHKIKGHETYSSPALGRFQSKEQHDVVALYSKGVWPAYSNASVFWVDGNNGKRLHKRDVGTFGIASPIVADLNQDGLDEVIVASNFHDVVKFNIIEQFIDDLPSLIGDLVNRYNEAFPAYCTHSYLVIFDGKTRRVLWSRQYPGFTASTPLLQDIDNNGKVDLIFVYAHRLIRYELDVRLSPSQLPWNQFRGTGADGFFRRK